ncbi:hypothetical protein CRM22_004331 [Opisthorchis felineus]|uniref:SCP domain-containing protein n=1 Tax=Opisthorchis felineus TaxID=147828 RepID=A0A4S2LWN4_OPIFE|nr:hypothetical protein CRM22_004331 [Opisthorchis felineus]
MKILRFLTLCSIVVGPNIPVNLALQRPYLQANEALELRAIANRLQPLLIGFMRLQRALDRVTSETQQLHAAFKDLAPVDATKVLIIRLTEIRNRMRTRQQQGQLGSSTQGDGRPQAEDLRQRQGQEAERSQPGSSNNAENEEQPGEPVYTIQDQNTGEAITVGLSPEILRDSEFLDRHNFYRRRLRDGTDPDGNRVPGLADLIWDEALADECRNWARTCVYQYAQNITAEENLASTTNVIGDPVQLWYEYRRQTGHYRKMVSPTAVYLGCHMTHCDVLQLVQAGSTQTNAFYTVCRYSTTKTTPEVPAEQM